MKREAATIDPRLPAAPEAEIGVCGSVLVTPPSIVEARNLRPTDFSSQNCAAFFAVATDFYRRGLPLDPLALATELASKPPFTSRIDVAEFFAELTEKVVTGAHAAYWVGLVAESSRKRRLLAMGEQVCEAALNGHSSREIINDLFSDVADFQRETVAEPLLSDAVPMSQFAAKDHQLEYLIPGVIVAGQPGVISAKSKSLKTTIALDAVISMETGSAFLNYWPVPAPVACGIISAESGAATLAETIHRICRSKGVDPSELNNCYISTRCPRLQSVEWLDEIRRFIESNELRCLLLDPTYLMLSGMEQNNLAAVAQALGPVGEIVRETGCSIIMVHHNRKVTSVPYGCPTLEEITGSGFAEWARFWLLLNRRREWEEETGRHWLWLVAGGSAGFGARKWLDVREGRQGDLGGRAWDVDIVAASEGESREHQERERQREQEKQAKVEGDQRAIIEAMRKCDRHQATKTDLKSRTGLNTDRLGVALAALLDRGDVEPCNLQKGKGQSYAGFQIHE
ncbi:MAG: AAA family ATPase [Pirellulales bacterium]